MLVERIKEACVNTDLSFNYGKDHWQNLKDLPEDSELPFADRAKYFLLLWQDRQFTFNKHGATIGFTFTGEAMLVVRSKFNEEDYNYKYETHIKNLQTESEKVLDDFNSCENWLVTNWKEIEIENAYDTNMDGLKIQFTLTYED